MTAIAAAPSKCSSTQDAAQTCGYRRSVSARAAQRDFLHAYAFRSHRGIRRYHAIALACQLRGTEDRRGLQLRCRLAARVHYKLQEIRHAHCRCIPPVWRDRPAPFRGQGTSRGRTRRLANVISFEPKNEPAVIWSSGDVKVSAVRSTHIAGHASYRIDTPAGSVVIGGDAGNDMFSASRAPRRPPIRSRRSRKELTSSSIRRTSHHGPEQRRRDAASLILPLEHGLRSRCDGEARGSEPSHAHASDPTARGRAPRPAEGAGWSSDGKLITRKRSRRAGSSATLS